MSFLAERRHASQNSELSSLFLILLLILSSVTACSNSPTEAELIDFSGPIMGTEYRITLATHDSDMTAAQQQALHDKLLDSMQAVNQSMSTYIADSELNRLNSLGKDSQFFMSESLAKVMAEAQRISHLSAGAFDVTLGPAIDLWGFGPQGRIVEQPNAAKLALLQRSVGYQLLEIQGRQISKIADNVAISLSAIAKGFAVDQVATTLLSLGQRNFLINIGGELRAAGKKSPSQEWRVGVETPRLLGGVQQIIGLPDAAIASSGDYRNFYLIDGQRFSHTIDPKTLKPVLHKLAAVSVIDSSAMTADALATALMAMGEERAWEFVQQQQLAAYLIIRDTHADTFTIKVSDSFQPYLR